MIPYENNHKRHVSSLEYKLILMQTYTVPESKRELCTVEVALGWIIISIAVIGRRERKYSTFSGGFVHSVTDNTRTWQ